MIEFRSGVRENKALEDLMEAEIISLAATLTKHKIYKKQLQHALAWTESEIKNPVTPLPEGVSAEEKRQRLIVVRLETMNAIDTLDEIVANFKADMKKQGLSSVVEVAEILSNIHS